MSVPKLMTDLIQRKSSLIAFKCNFLNVKVDIMGLKRLLPPNVVVTVHRIND